MSRPPRLHAAIPASPAQAARVRRLVTEHLRRLPSATGHLDDVVLATDELFTNAVRHAGTGPDDLITLTIDCRESELRVTIADRSPALPRMHASDEAAESGRGLAIVAALADDWGIAPADPGTPGKRVWFALRLGAAP
ncbi:ATP-binding protein [Streptomyces cinnabarinus]|uniref:ATP-binding protein n=1 Tax=Streptomyces cinnabarinus TaxID=67287 RepID=A0ABY7KKM6_9ACTN|nr:ATP-binding protein [Streptomyces cinnabarinus]WAZ25108.1 ATP-binding protein [Streptomyces cinnabarinus]